MESGSQNKIICALCEKSDETTVTGPLSSKGSISAHQNCLLYASGLFCRISPTYDDLFGFEVEDVKKELKRGRRLSCHRCKKIGATAGCDEKRCKRSYHFPCAIEDHARTIEDPSKGSYILFCELHDPESKKPKYGLEPFSPDASNVGTTVKSKSSAAIFWTRCNEARWTKEIFSDLVSQLSSLGERVQSQEASQQDYDVALKVLGASGRLPCIVTQLEQDLEKQERDLQRKKAALRDAKAALGV